MSAEVEILTELDNVLTVPLTAVNHSPFAGGLSGPDYVAVKKADGGLDWRKVVLGLASDSHVEVKEGIRSGELVIVNPPPR